MSGTGVHDAGPLLHHMRSKGLLPATGSVEVEVLAGGVSNDVIGLSGPGINLVVKQALSQLRVDETWLADPARIGTEARGLAIAEELVPGSAPRVVDFADELLVIERAPRSWRPWKDELLAGRIDVGVAERLGRLIGQWQRLSAARPDVLHSFGDRTAFGQLRVDPFHRTVAERHPDLAAAIGGVIEAMHLDRRTLVHGDYSPKNVLVDPAGTAVWVIDWEVAHTGDPTFDPAWVVGHLLLKAIRDRSRADLLRAAAEAFLAGRAAEAEHEVPLDAAQLTGQVGCLMLARVDGKSPVDYLDDDGRHAARRISARLLTDPPPTVTKAWELL